MGGETFASILMLRKAEEQARILAVLHPERRETVQEHLKALDGLSFAQIQERLTAHRKEQQKTQVQRAEKRFGRSLDHALPRLVEWLGRPF
jgi:uncharacterized small protein (DUF1192 family)